MTAKTRSTLDQISESLDLAAMLTLLFPLAFPVIALIDGAQVGYTGLAIVYLGIATLASCAAMLLLTEASAFLSRIVSDSIRQEANRA